jgi:hypothetical protein
MSPRLLVAPRIRGAKGATSMRSQHGLPAARQQAVFGALPAVGRQVSGRRRSAAAPQR